MKSLRTLLFLLLPFATLFTFTACEDIALLTAVDSLVKARSPVYSVEAGEYDEDQYVELSTATEGAQIFYTTDGEDPDSSSTLYTEPVPIAGHETEINLKSIAILDPMANSDISSALYKIEYVAVAAPEFSPAAGIQRQDISIEISSATSSADIYYTIDGTVPTESSIPYTAPILLEDDSSEISINAYAVHEGFPDSPVTFGYFKIDYLKNAAPTTTVADGTYANNLQVPLSTTTEGAVIHYTTTGEDPVTAVDRGDGYYTLNDSSGTITLTNPGGVDWVVFFRAKAFKDQMKTSDLLSRTYTIQP
jgi:hypothetical protein